MSSAIVTELNIYPVKSMRGIALPVMPITAMGPQWDRRWMLVDKAGGFISQREEPRLCLLDTVLGQEQLTVSAPSYSSVSVDTTARGEAREVEVWGDKVAAIDCGDSAAHWFSRFLKRDCRLVYMPATTTRQVDAAYSRVGDSVSFADGFPLLLISEASLDELNRRLEIPVTMAHFRPNIVVSGCEPFAEDRWQKVQLGAVEFDLVKPCSRCVIPSINPATAIKNSQVLRELAAFRRWQGKVYFGQNLIHRGLGKIALGESLKVLLDRD